MRWDEAADLFAKDATLEIVGRGLFSGQDHIRIYLHALGELKYGAFPDVFVPPGAPCSYPFLTVPGAG